MESGRLDGTLHRWETIADEHDWRTLPIGNGLSTNVWPDFRYRTLFDFADLSPTDRILFEAEETPNFELVLGTSGQRCGSRGCVASARARLSSSSAGTTASRRR